MPATCFLRLQWKLQISTGPQPRLYFWMRNRCHAAQQLPSKERPTATTPTSSPHCPNLKDTVPPRSSSAFISPEVPPHSIPALHHRGIAETEHNNGPNQQSCDTILPRSLDCKSSTASPGCVASATRTRLASTSVLPHAVTDFGRRRYSGTVMPQQRGLRLHEGALAAWPWATTQLGHGHALRLAGGAWSMEHSAGRLPIAIPTYHGLRRGSMHEGVFPKLALAACCRNSGYGGSVGRGQYAASAAELSGGDSSAHASCC